LEYCFEFGFLLASISIIFCTRASATVRFVRNATDPFDNRIYTLPVVSPLFNSACATRNGVIVSGFLPAALLFMLLEKQATAKIVRSLKRFQPMSIVVVRLENLPFIGLGQLSLRPRQQVVFSGFYAIDCFVECWDSHKRVIKDTARFRAVQQ
jgi:hypothetical protein